MIVRQYDEQLAKWVVLTDDAARQAEMESRQQDAFVRYVAPLAVARVGDNLLDLYRNQMTDAAVQMVGNMMEVALPEAGRLQGSNLTHEQMDVLQSIVVAEVLGRLKAIAKEGLANQPCWGS